MPTPDPTVDGPGPNPDGSNTTVTTTTTYHPNGSKKSVRREVKTPDGDLREETLDEFKKGDGPGADGDKSRSRKVVIDDQNRETEHTDTKFKNGKKKTSYTRNTDYNRRPPRRVVVEILYCPDGTTEKKKITRVFYKPERNWREETRERKTKTKKCTTGKEVAFGFPQDMGDYSLLAFAAAALIFATAGWSTSGNGYWALGFISLLAAAVLYGRYLHRKCDHEMEVIELYEAMLDIDDDDGTAEEQTEPEQRET